MAFILHGFYFAWLLFCMAFILHGFYFA